MAQPLLARLKQSGATIDVLAPEWVAPVVRRMPEVDEVIAAPLRHGALQLGERWRLGRSLERRGYEAAYVLPNSWKSALVPFFAGSRSASATSARCATGLNPFTHPSKHQCRFITHGLPAGRIHRWFAKVERLGRGNP